MSGDVQAEWGAFKTAKKFNARSLPSAGENSYEQVYYRWVVERWEEWDTWQYFDYTKSFYNNLNSTNCWTHGAKTHKPDVRSILKS